MGHKSLYGTPVDGLHLVARPDPETPLVIFPMDDARRGQLYVAQPASWPALTPRQREQVSGYFEWDPEESYWWHTLRPAIVSLDRLGAEIFSSRLLERGAIVAAGRDPRLVPDYRFLFSGIITPAPRRIRYPHEPMLASGTDVPLRSNATTTVLATFPTLGADPVWLRKFVSGAERPARLKALDAELGVLRILAELRPGSVIDVAHDGHIEGQEYSGRYAAFRPPVGLSVRAALNASRGYPFPRAEPMLASIVLDVVETAACAKGSGYCVGPISPESIYVRPNIDHTGRAARATLVALPGSGPAGGRVSPGILELYPEMNSPHLVRQFEAAYTRSPSSDLLGIGHLSRWLAEIGGGVARLDRLGQDILARQLTTFDEVATALSGVASVESARDSNEF